MKKFLAMVIFLVLLSSIAYGQEEQLSSEVVINQAQKMGTVKKKVDYLLTQAQAFYDSKDFQKAIDVAQYILNYLDKNSQAAKDLIAKAQEALNAETLKAGDKIKGTITILNQ